ncbi:HAD family hydrolase [Auraticoccus monumenti]|uniref:Putative hydrolase of the HAD superfamily n=1 Tax=Auraticoccus monumenti TaxID=675864 RepID=A0A1G7A3R3_9ACTN|nr:HAD family hydrolase [Auraticoccus monumenti]SDE09442.1 putative hydrolase of the HAD superfamily [Auraticoccus monumenti]
MHASITTVIFDLDGTLFDHQASAALGVAGLTEQLGAQSTADLEAAWFAAEDRHVQSWASGACGWQEQRRRRLRDYLPLVGVEAPDDEAELDRLFAVYLDCCQRSWSAFPDAAPALRAVRAAGYQVAVLTNGQRQQQLAKLERIALLQLVGPVWATDDLGVAKPDPKTYLTVCDHLGVSPSETVYVGDNFAHDVEGAEGAGLRAAFLDRHDQGPTDYRPRISSLRDLLQAIETPAPS